MFLRMSSFLTYVIISVSSTVSTRSSFITSNGSSVVAFGMHTRISNILRYIGWIMFVVGSPRGSHW